MMLCPIRCVFSTIFLCPTLADTLLGGWAVTHWWAQNRTCNKEEPSGKFRNVDPKVGTPGCVCTTKLVYFSRFPCITRYRMSCSFRKKLKNLLGLRDKAYFNLSHKLRYLSCRWCYKWRSVILFGLVLGVRICAKLRLVQQGCRFRWLLLGPL